MTRRIFALLLAMLSAAAHAASNIDTSEAKQIDLPREYSLNGVIEVTNQSTISAQTTGQVLEILADVDDFVQQGSLIIRLKDTQHQARLQQAKAEQLAANARLQEAQQDHDRTREIFKRGVVSQSALDKATAALKAAQANRDAANAALSQAQEQLSYTQIRAPYSGIVTERLIEVGETATPGQGLMSGISLDQLRVNVDVPQNLVPQIREHPQGDVELPDGTRVSAASITIFPYADPRSGTFKVRMQLPHGIKQLFPGMLVKCVFELGSRQALVIPQQSVVYRSEVTAVYVVDTDNQLRMRHIQTGRKTGEQLITVLSGLEAGERVALDPIAAGSLLKSQTAGNRHE